MSAFAVSTAQFSTGCSKRELSHSQRLLLRFIISDHFGSDMEVQIAKKK